MNSTEVVERLNDLIHHKSHRKNLVVFDLDSTLYDVSGRTKAILTDCAKQADFSKKFPKSSQQLQNVEVRSTDWGIKESLVRSDIKENLSFFEEIRNFWIEHFFANKYLQHDQPYEGAVDFVNHFVQADIPIVYLTARNKKKMYEGSVDSLARCGFPSPDEDRVRLIMKEHHESGDHIFKRDVLFPMLKEFDDIWFFENEPRIIELVQEDCPTINIVFVKSVHSGYAKDPDHLLRLDSRFPKLDDVTFAGEES